ncbi:MAG: hypothetical protein IMW93_05905 [Thermoanaerobacteraceae bacterium]|nr:hypothetical protein [Thermoanaerobacteraceae bacterium]
MMSDIIPTILSGETAMDRMPLLALIFQSIPESVITLTLGLTLMGIDLKWKRIIPAAVLSSLASYFVRELPISYGLHTLIGIGVITLLVIFFRISLVIALNVALVGIASLALVELLYWPLLLLITNQNITAIWHSQTLRILAAVPELVTLSLITGYCIKRKFTLRTPDNKQKKHKDQGTDYL